MMMSRVDGLSSWGDAAEGALSVGAAPTDLHCTEP